MSVHVYRANQDMERVFWNADGELLIVPQQGRLAIATELGRLEVAPGEIAVIPRAVRFRVVLPDGAVRGYVCENHGPVLRLPELGPIGANGLANPRDFLSPATSCPPWRGSRTKTNQPRSFRSSWARYGQRP